MAEPDYSEVDRAVDEAARERDAKRETVKDREEKRLAGALLALLPKRDLLILEWICKSQNKTPGQIGTEMIHQSLVRERKNYREAHGGGGASSTNSELLAARLPGK